MVEQSVQPNLTEPAPQEVVPPVVEPKKARGVLWLAVLVAITVLGGAGYVLYVQLSGSVEQEASTIPPVVVTQEAATETPSVAPALSASDSISDIEKDLDGTALESGDTTEFDADLQSL